MNDVFPDPIKRLPQLDLPYPGVTGYLIQGPHEQIVFMEFTTTVHVPEHTHHSQWEHVIAGTVDLTMNGTTTTYTKGDSFYIPKGKPHAATVHAGYHCLIYFDQPDRYTTKSKTR